MMFVDTKEMIKEEAERIGLDVIGFTSCRPFLETAEILRGREAAGYLSGFEESDIQKRTDPRLIMEDCSTIIAAGISYNVDQNKAGIKEYYAHKTRISRAAWGTDYHKVLKLKLDKLAVFINEGLGGNTKVFVDTGPLVEREVAKRAGIGYTGRNCSIINPRFGSFIFLGEILTDIRIEPDKPLEENCGDCNLCLKACPTGALCSPYTVNAKQCISYLTQSRDLSCEEYGKIGSSIYGCDICQAVCPKNKGVSISRHGEFIPREWNLYPDAVDILEMDNKTFQETFKNTSAGWRGKKILQRNAIIAIANSGIRAGAKYIVKMLDDSRKDIRETSVYALYRLLGEASIPMLEEHLLKGKNEEIKGIIIKIKNKN